MKQSTGRLLGARLLSHPAALGIGLAAAVVAGISACGGGGSGNDCHNLAQAVGLIGQSSYTFGASSNGGVSGLNFGGTQGSTAAYTDPTTNATTVFVADTTNNRILAFNGLPSAQPNGINTQSAAYVIGQTNFNSSQGGIQAANGDPVQFSFPSKIWTQTINGTVYFLVADSGNNRVLIWNGIPTPASGSITVTTPPSIVLGQPDFTTGDANHPNATISASSLSHPTAGIISTKGAVAVVDNLNSRVLIWNSIPTVNDQPADIELGQNALASLTSDPVQTANCTTSSSSTPTTSWCFGTNVQSIDQPISASTPTYNLAMRLPADVWTDGTNLLVSDYSNNRVLFWSTVPNTMNLLATAVLGQNQFGTYTPAGGSGTTGMNAPFGVASDGNNVFIADTGNNRVLMYPSFIVSPKNGAAATYLYGQQDFTHVTANDPDQNNQIGDQRQSPNTNGVTAGTFSAPQGVFASASLNIILVTDSVNSRVLQFPITANPGNNGTGYYAVNGADTDDTNYCD